MVAVKVIARSGKELATVNLPKNPTLAQLKTAFQKAKPKYYPERQRFTYKAPDGAITVLKDDDRPISEYGVEDGDNVIFKDLGPQVSWRLVFVVEYMGPILIFLLFYLYPEIIYRRPLPARTLTQTLAFWMAVAHFLKREYESVFIHRFSHGTMPISRIFINSIHYWGFFALATAYFLYHPDYTDPEHTPARLYTHVGLFAFFEIMNLATHVVLRNLRSRGSKQRGIPNGYGFGYVSCANYFWETCIWACFALMVNCLTTYIFLGLSFYQMNEWAQQKHRRYITEFTGKNGTLLYPQQVGRGGASQEPPRDYSLFILTDSNLNFESHEKRHRLQSLPPAPRAARAARGLPARRRPRVLERVHLDRRHFRASLKSKTSLRIEAPLYDYEYSFPESEHELSLAPIFFDLVQEQLRSAQKQHEARIARMQAGTPVTKFNYNNARRCQKLLWLSPDQKELCWVNGTRKKPAISKNYSRILMADCVAIRYGPQSPVLQRILRAQNAKKVRIFNSLANTQSDSELLKDWLTFTLFTSKRSFDFVANSQRDARCWVLGLSHLLRDLHKDPTTTAPPPPSIHSCDFLRNKIRLKFQHSARRLNLTTNAYLRVSFRDAVSRAFTSAHSRVMLSRASSHNALGQYRAETPELRTHSRMSAESSYLGGYTSRSQVRGLSPCFYPQYTDRPPAALSRSHQVLRRGSKHQNSWRSDIGGHPRCLYTSEAPSMADESQPRDSMSSESKLEFQPPLPAERNHQQAYAYPRPPPQPQQTSQKRVAKTKRFNYHSNQENQEPNLAVYSSINQNSTKANSHTNSVIGDSHPMFKKQRAYPHPPSIHIATLSDQSESEQSEEEEEDEAVQFHLTNKQELPPASEASYASQMALQSAVCVSDFKSENLEEIENYQPQFSEDDDQCSDVTEDIPEQTEAGVEEVSSLYSDPPSSDRHMAFPVETEEREYRPMESGDLSGTKRFPKSAFLRARKMSVCYLPQTRYLRKPPRPLTSLGFNTHSSEIIPPGFRDISPVNQSTHHETHESGSGFSRSQLDQLISGSQYRSVAQRPRSIASAASVRGRNSARKLVTENQSIMTHFSLKQEEDEDGSVQEELKTERKNPQPLIFHPQSANKAVHYPRPSTGTANFASVPSSRMQTCESVISKEPLVGGEADEFPTRGGGELILCSVEGGNGGRLRGELSPQELMMCNSSFSLEYPQSREETTFDQNKLRNQIRIFENSGCSLLFQHSTNCVTPSEGLTSVQFPQSVESEKNRAPVLMAAASPRLGYNSIGTPLQRSPEPSERQIWQERVRKLEEQLAAVKQEKEESVQNLEAELARQRVKIGRLEAKLEKQSQENQRLRNVGIG